MSKSRENKNLSPLKLKGQVWAFLHSTLILSNVANIIAVLSQSFIFIASLIMRLSHGKKSSKKGPDSHLHILSCK